MTGRSNLSDDYERGVSRTVYRDLKPSPVIDAFDKRALLERTDPLLALAYYVEAVADGRAGCGVDAYSKIAAMQQEARRMLRQVGAPLGRVAELYPRYSEMSQSPARTK